MPQCYRILPAVNEQRSGSQGSMSDGMHFILSYTRILIEKIRLNILKMLKGTGQKQISS